VDLDLPLVGHVVNLGPSSTSTPALTNKGKTKDECNSHETWNVWHPPWKWI
jgi:hypothetical protein